MTARHWVSTWSHFNIFNGRLNGTGIEPFFFRCSIGPNQSSLQSGPGGIVFHCWKCLLTAGNMAACGSFWVVCESAFRTSLHMSNGHVAANKRFTVQQGRTQMWRDVRAYVTLRMSQDKRQKKEKGEKKTSTPATSMSQNTLSRTKDLYVIWENRPSLHYKCNKALSSQVVTKKRNLILPVCVCFHEVPKRSDAPHNVKRQIWRAVKNTLICIYRVVWQDLHRSQLESYISSRHSARNPPLATE